MYKKVAILNRINRFIAFIFMVALSFSLCHDVSAHFIPLFLGVYFAIFAAHLIILE